ncbi:MAG TPA: O-antigen ligase family protein [Solirubrobacteraceae bacterium]|nr:O-antigen ligase family protein [Solirubrobacteraceae bacterium]
MLTPLLVLAGVLAARRLWEVPPATLMCVALALTVFSGAWGLIGLGGLPLDRLAILGVLLAVFLRAPGIAHTPRLQLRNVHLLMGVTVLYVVGSAAVAGTLTNETGSFTLIDQFGAAPYLVFLLAPSIFAGRRERNLLLGTLVALGGYLGITAIFESLGPHGLVFPSYIVHVDAILPEARAGGPFQSSVGEGFATFACAVAAVIAFTQWRGLRRRYIAALVAGVSMLGCFLTQERAVWIAAALAGAVAALATKAGRRWIIPCTSICALLIGGALLLSPALASKVTGRIEYKPSVWDRQNQTAAAFRMIQERPLFGLGWNRYETDSIEYFRQSENYPLVGYSTTVKPQPLHDSYLSYTVELGLIGALLWLASLFWGVGSAVLSRGPAELRPWKLGLLAVGVFFVVVSLFNPYLQAFPILLLWTWAGVALGGESLSVQARRAQWVAWLNRRAAEQPA